MMICGDVVTEVLVDVLSWVHTGDPNLVALPLLSAPFMGIL